MVTHTAHTQRTAASVTHRWRPLSPSTAICGFITVSTAEATWRQALAHAANGPCKGALAWAAARWGAAWRAVGLGRAPRQRGAEGSVGETLRQSEKEWICTVRHNIAAICGRIIAAICVRYVGEMGLANSWPSTWQGLSCRKGYYDALLRCG